MKMTGTKYLFLFALLGFFIIMTGGCSFIAKSAYNATVFTLETSAKAVYHTSAFTVKSLWTVTEFTARILLYPLSLGGSSSMKGIASWYEDTHTASGELYQRDLLTAAHKKLPFGTIVKVLNLDNGKSVNVRINDRGPFVRGRVIDLSYSAAKEIDMLEAGLARVRLVVIEKGGS